jgi:hypothetical protein
MKNENNVAIAPNRIFDLCFTTIDIPKNTNVAMKIITYKSNGI